MGYDAPRYTQTPNLFLDEHLPEMGPAETKVVLAIIRQTFGWHKDKDRLSISQLMEMTGLSNRAVIDGTKEALERGIISRRESGNSYEYWLVIENEESSQGTDGGVNNAHRGCEDTSQEGVNDTHTQKKTKETSQKESTRTHEEPRAVQMYHEVFPRRATQFQQDLMKKTVEDLDVWQDVLEYWKGNGHRAKSVKKMLNKYTEDVSAATKADNWDDSWI